MGVSCDNCVIGLIGESCEYCDIGCNGTRSACALSGCELNN